MSSLKDMYTEALMLTLTAPQKTALLALIQADKELTKEEWRLLLPNKRLGMATIQKLEQATSRLECNEGKYSFSFVEAVAAVIAESAERGEEKEERVIAPQEAARAFMEEMLQGWDAHDAGREERMAAHLAQLKAEDAVKFEASRERTAKVFANFDVAQERLHQAHEAMVDALSGGASTQMTALETLDLNPAEEHTFSEIRKAYKSKMQEVHPDKEGGSEEQAQAVSQAFETLKTLAKERVKQRKTRRE